MTDHSNPSSEEELVRALSAPGTATELQQEEHYLAMFREAQPAAPDTSLPRRTVGRLGAGGSAVVVTVVLTSGVAAAYSGHLPDPVQQLAHTVIGAPAPDHPSRHHRGPGAQPRVTPTPHASAGTPASSTAPTAPGSGTPTGRPAVDSGPHPTPSAGSSLPASGPSAVPPRAPSPSPSPSASGTPGAAAVPAVLTMSGTTHRALVGEEVTFTTVLGDVDGVALSDHAIALQVLTARRWHSVAQAVTDSSGTASVTMTLPRSSAFRWRADHRVRSPRWSVRLVPGLTVGAQVGAVTTEIDATTAGTSTGDRALLVKRTAQGAVVVARGSLGEDGSVAFTVATPHRRTVYGVRLLATRRHTTAQEHVVVTPPAASAVAIDGVSHQVSAGTSTSLTGLVTSSSGAALPGRKVLLQRLGPSRWVTVGHGTTDGNGSVSIATPLVMHTGIFRLRTGAAVHSARWRLVEVPTVSVTASREGDAVAIAASTYGARTGDRVILLRRRSGGGLVQVSRSTLTSDGSATFTAPVRRTSTTYVVRLPATRHHGAAVANVKVPGA